jgi:hypothetical protein
MESTMKRMTESGIEWLYRPGFIYVAKHRKLNLKVERCLAGAKTGRGWRLFAGHGPGIGLSFHHQFWPTAKAARAEGRRLAEGVVA